MWNILQGCSYHLILLHNAPNFWKLENFPTHTRFLAKTNYLLYTDAQNHPFLFPYEQKQYGSDQTNIVGQIYYPWKTLAQALHQLDNQWEMKGKLTLAFCPRFLSPEEFQYLENLQPVLYRLTPYPYGHVAAVERWVKLRKPDEFPILSDWLYQTRYLTFHHTFLPQRVFVAHSVDGKFLTQGQQKHWTILAKENCDYLTPNIIAQFHRDHWKFHGELVIHFHGVDSLEQEQDIVQFLFTNQNFCGVST